MITPSQLARLRALIDAGKEERFYSWKSWRRLSRRVRDRLDNNECQNCKRLGKVGTADVVHHIKHLRDLGSRHQGAPADHAVQELPRAGASGTPSADSERSGKPADGGALGLTPHQKNAFLKFSPNR